MARSRAEITAAVGRFVGSLILALPIMGIVTFAVQMGVAIGLLHCVERPVLAVLGANVSGELADVVVRGNWIPFGLALGLPLGAMLGGFVAGLATRRIGAGAPLAGLVMCAHLAAFSSALTGHYLPEIGHTPGPVDTARWAYAGWNAYVLMSLLTMPVSVAGAYLGLLMPGLGKKTPRP